MMPLALFGGLLVNLKTLPIWIGWMQYLSPIRYALESLTRNEFSGRSYGIEDVNPVDYLGYNVGTWRCLVFLGCLALGLRVITLYFLRMRVSRV